MVNSEFDRESANSTVNVSVPDAVNEAFDAAFKGQNKSAIVKQPMREAVERAEGSERCRAASPASTKHARRHLCAAQRHSEPPVKAAAGKVVLKLKTPWRDGTTHLVMPPLEFMQRLASLVPRPRLHLIRFHGVLAPNAKPRAMVVPQAPALHAQVAPPAECEANCAHHRPVRLS